MRRPPSIAMVTQYPVTGATALLALAMTGLWWLGRDISFAFLDPPAWHGQPWRLVTSALPHLDPFHLLFNLYWLWAFGTLIEAAFGPLRTLAMFLLLAAASGAAEYAVLEGGVGLSGLGYGLFGFLWVASRRDPRFRAAVDAMTVAIFVTWFFLCIALTLAKLWAVANVAHAAGAAIGILLGLAATGRRTRWVYGTLVAAALLAIGAAATAGRPYLNFSPDALAAHGYYALSRDDDETARALYRRAIRLHDGEADWWYNLAVACDRLGREDEALYASKRALRLAGEGRTRGLVARLRAHLAHAAHTAGRLDRAVELYRAALAADGADAETWYNLGLAYQALKRTDDAREAFKKAAALEPKDETYRKALEGP